MHRTRRWSPVNERDGLVGAGVVPGRSYVAVQNFRQRGEAVRRRWRSRCGVCGRAAWRRRRAHVRPRSCSDMFMAQTYGGLKEKARISSHGPRTGSRLLLHEPSAAWRACEHRLGSDVATTREGCTKHHWAQRQARLVALLLLLLIQCRQNSNNRSTSSTCLPIHVLTCPQYHITEL